MNSISAVISAGAVFLTILAPSNRTDAYAQSQNPAAAISTGPAPGAAPTDSSSDSGEATVPDPNPPNEDSTSIGVPLLKHILSDQKAIWTSPAHLRWSDANWLIPLAGASAVLFATDRSVNRSISTNPTTVNHFISASNYGIYGMGAFDGGIYLWGKFSHDDHRTETGILAGEAALDSVAVGTAFKYAFGRERPYQNTSVPFFSGGDGFPSDHSLVAWSVASVFAHEYPGPLTQIAAYGLASAISASRVLGRQHSPSDVFVGAAIGWLVGQHVYRAHHNPDLEGGSWESPREAFGDSDRQPSSKGSPYVPLDSWIYPALDRLIGLGYIHSAFMDSKPWTRLECAALVDEAGNALGENKPNAEEAHRLYETLSAEFAGDLDVLSGDRNLGARLESVYTRATDISGPPLRDSYHFGQTIINDFGRPYAEGLNDVTGFSGWASSGRYSVYVRGEYQHAPFAPAYSQGVQNFIAQADSNPIQQALPTPAVNQFTLLDTYALANVDNWELSFGKQSLWWGPAEGGALTLSDNTEPILMFRARQMMNLDLPSILRFLGPIKVDLFIGQLADNLYPARPMLHGQKVTIEPTKNLELSLSATSEFGGVGRPITAASIFNSFFSTKSSDTYAANASPGKRSFGVDFTYKVPGLRDWLSIYGDTLVPEDNPTNYDMSQNPIYTPRRAAQRSGLYLSHVPRVPKLDFRFESVYTNPPTPRSFGGQYIYYNNFYHDLFTNKNYIIGDWIGREGMGFQGWTTYWFSPRTSFQLGYRHAKVATDFIPGGETLNDGSAALSLQVRDDVTVTAGLQYEKWLAPILAPAAQTNWTTSIGVTYWPHFVSH